MDTTDTKLRSPCGGQNGVFWAFARATHFLECDRPACDICSDTSPEGLQSEARLAAGIHPAQTFASWLP